MIEVDIVTFGNILFVIMGVVIALATYSMRDWYVTLIGLPLSCYIILVLGFLIINDWLVIT